MVIKDTYGSVNGASILRVLSTFCMFVGIAACILISACEKQGSSSRTTSGTSESALARILSSGTIRCGWVTNPPACYKDPATGQLMGIFVEAFEYAAKMMSLEVRWTEEVGFGSMIEGLSARRYDAIPSAIWPTAARARQADFSNPLYFSGVGIFVRADDNRFNNDLSRINSPAVKIATIDGEMAAAIAASDFPRAQTISLPQLSEIPTMLLNVKEKKADLTFVELFFAYEFLKKNPGSIKNITPDKPIRVFPNTVLLPQGEPGLKAFINTALGEILNLGVVDKLIRKYEPQPGTFYRLAIPYQTTMAETH